MRWAFFGLLAVSALTACASLRVRPTPVPSPTLGAATTPSPSVASIPSPAPGALAPSPTTLRELPAGPPPAGATVILFAGCQCDVTFLSKGLLRVRNVGGYVDVKSVQPGSAVVPDGSVFVGAAWRGSSLFSLHGIYRDGRRSGAPNVYRLLISDDAGDTWRVVGDMEPSVENSFVYLDSVAADGTPILSGWDGEHMNSSSRFRWGGGKVSLPSRPSGAAIQPVNGAGMWWDRFAHTLLGPDGLRLTLTEVEIAETVSISPEGRYALTGVPATASGNWLWIADKMKVQRRWELPRYSFRVQWLNETNVAAVSFASGPPGVVIIDVENGTAQALGSLPQVGDGGFWVPLPTLTAY